MTQRIDIEIDEQGNSTVEVFGCSGPECKRLTAELEKALGRTVSDQKKPEFHQHHVQQNKAQQR